MGVATLVECQAETMRTLVVQPDALCREGLTRLLREFDELCVMPPAASVVEGLDRMDTAMPDLVVTELDLPVDDGLAFVDSLCRLPNPPAVVVVSRQTGWAYVRAALERGARGYLPRTASPGELQEAIRRARSGQRYVHHALAANLLDMTIGASEQGLTERECALLVRIAQGDTNHEIAQALFLSEKTVRNALTRLFHKLRVRNRMAALAAARQQGYL